MIYDFFALLFPRICLACGKALFKHEQCICTLCQFHLPKTNFHAIEDNPVARVFWGRAPIHSAAAYYYFTKGLKVQHLIHQLKYKKQKEVGLVLGEMYGKELMQSPLFSSVEIVIPVPMHPKKQKKRGYNQAEILSVGIATGMGVLVDAHCLHKTVATQTQTKRSRINRWENVKEIFAIRDMEQLAGKHVLLIDDVITTGATIEACVIELLKIPEIKISVAALACTT